MKIKLLIFAASIMLFSCNMGQSSKEEEIAWKICLEANTLSAIDSFLSEFPDTKRKTEIAKKRDGILYRTAIAENTIFHLKNYMREFPQGKYKSEIEKKIKEFETDKINLEDLESKTFVGNLIYTNKKNSGNNILSMKFKLSEDRGSTLSYQVTAYLSSNLKKELSAEIEKEKMSIKFAEDQEDEFQLDFPDGKIYLKNNEIFIESVDPSAGSYWNLK
jgi:hypothetical protein